MSIEKFYYEFSIKKCFMSSNPKASFLTDDLKRSIHLCCYALEVTICSQLRVFYSFLLKSIENIICTLRFQDFSFNQFYSKILLLLSRYL